MPREWQIWVCTICPYIIEKGDDENQMYCTGDGCGSIKMNWEPEILHEYQHKEAPMELVKVQEIS